MIQNDKIIAIPPGATINEQLLTSGLSKTEFASRMDLTLDDAEQLLNGDLELNEEIALKLTSIFGIPTQFFLNLEKTYRKRLKEIGN